MRHPLLVFALVVCLCGPSIHGQKPPLKATGHYMFAWTGDVAKKGNDFLAVIDADPASPTYGKPITTLVTDQQTVRVHHTEYVMPESGRLFANDHDAGRTFIFDVRDPLHPKVVTSFTDMDGYMHPHSYLRVPNGHVLVSFQHAHRDMNGSGMGDGGGVTYQVWRLSDLKLLKTANLDVGENHHGHVSPEEPQSLWPIPDSHGSQGIFCQSRLHHFHGSSIRFTEMCC
jgi:56kDa selenium binding protein (SBP56)